MVSLEPATRPLWLRQVRLRGVPRPRSVVASVCWSDGRPTRRYARGRCRRAHLLDTRAHHDRRGGDHPVLRPIVGQTTEKPLLLLHGVTSSSLGWWRVGSGLAAAGFRVFAPDMPGHGRTGSWRGHWRFRDTTRELVALVDALGVSRDELRLVGRGRGPLGRAVVPSTRGCLSSDDCRRDAA
jgi:pimeloyl-ACP methyl ester carboxylesterase